MDRKIKRTKEKIFRGWSTWTWYIVGLVWHSLCTIASVGHRGTVHITGIHGKLDNCLPDNIWVSLHFLPNAIPKDVDVPHGAF